MRSELFIALLMCVAIAVFPACGQKTGSASITKLAFGNNAKADPPVTSFEVDKVIYVVATVANATGKHNLNFQVTADDNVTNKAKGDHVMNKSIDFEGNEPLFLNFLLAYPGNYKIDAVLSDANGKQIDTKSGMITVTGEPAPLEDEEHDKEKERERETGRDKDKDKDKDRK